MHVLYKYVYDGDTRQVRVRGCFFSVVCFTLLTSRRRYNLGDKRFRPYFRYMYIYTPSQ